MKKILITLGIVAFAASAHAAGPDFATADTDQNGMVSMEELKAAMPDVTDEAATAADADADGSLNAEEYAALAG